MQAESVAPVVCLFPRLASPEHHIISIVQLYRNMLAISTDLANLAVSFLGATVFAINEAVSLPVF
jgi:hypothetical protein